LINFYLDFFTFRMCAGLSVRIIHRAILKIFLVRLVFTSISLWSINFLEFSRCLLRTDFILIARLRDIFEHCVVSITRTNFLLCRQSCVKYRSMSSGVVSSVIPILTCVMLYYIYILNSNTSSMNIHKGRLHVITISSIYVGRTGVSPSSGNIICTNSERGEKGKYSPGGNDPFKLSKHFL